jgi:hypothetical protein
LTIATLLIEAGADPLARPYNPKVNRCLPRPHRASRFHYDVGRTRRPARALVADTAMIPEVPWLSPCRHYDAA